MPKLKNSNVTFWGTFKHCVIDYIHLVLRQKPSGCIHLVYKIHFLGLYLTGGLVQVQAGSKRT